VNNIKTIYRILIGCCIICVLIDIANITNCGIKKVNTNILSIDIDSYLTRISYEFQQCNYSKEINIDCYLRNIKNISAFVTKLESSDSYDDEFKLYLLYQHMLGIMTTKSGIDAIHENIKCYSQLFTKLSESYRNNKTNIEEIINEIENLNQCVTDDLNSVPMLRFIN